MRETEERERVMRAAELEALAAMEREKEERRKV